MPSIMQHIGTPNERHNKDNKYRAQLENVDPSLSKYNAILREKSVEDIYAEKLQPAFDAFNAKQKRKDRRLDVKWGVSSALELQRAMDEKARASKNAIDQKGRPPIREIVWQIGNPEQGYGCAGQTPEHREKVKQMLLECQQEAERRYPQLAWGDLVFHADEVSLDANDEVHGSLHLHSEFTPLCFKNKQGPSVQVAMERCLKEMGFETFQAWKHDLDSIMEDVLHRHDLERTIVGNTEKHQDSTEYHRQQRLIRQTKSLEEQRSQAAQKAEEAESTVKYLEGFIQDAKAEIAALGAEKASAEQRARDAEAKAQELESLLKTQEHSLSLIGSYEEYCREADIAEADLDLGERIAKRLPPPKGIFKPADEKEWLRDMKTMLQKLLSSIGDYLRRMQIFEVRYSLQDRRSEPAQKRADSLHNKIQNACSRAEAAPGKGNTQEKGEHSR